MRYREIIKEAEWKYTDRFAPYFLKRGFTEPTEPVHAMGTSQGDPHHLSTHTFVGHAPAAEYGKVEKAILSFLKRNDLTKMSKMDVKWGKDPKTKTQIAEIKVAITYPTETPTPADRPKIKIPFHKDSDFKVGDDVEINSSGNSATKMGIIGVGSTPGGTIVKDNGDGTFIIRPRTSNPSNPYNDVSVSGDNLSLVDVYWHGAEPAKNGRYKHTKGQADYKDYEELALHPSERGTVTLTGKHKATGERHKLDNAYLDQIHNRFRQKGENHYFSKNGVVPDKDWWESLSPAEQQRYAAY